MVRRTDAAGGLVQIESITVIGGRGRDGQPEPVQWLELRMGEVASVVGPTGSGKSALINDIGLFADGGTSSGRRVLVNGAPPAPEFLEDPARNPVALITQHTGFLSDLPVHEFLTLHARIRKARHPGRAVEETLEFANQLTGEPIAVESAMTELSGGQSRALLIADATVIGSAPVILLDEIENAGIDRARALELLRGHRKIFLFVTHDLHIALLSDCRLVMRGGAMQQLIRTGDGERRMAARLRALEELMLYLRNQVRAGERLSEAELEGRLALAVAGPEAGGER
jgi:ABC-type lipoprotein export system ATPase subunit